MNNYLAELHSYFDQKKTGSIAFLEHLQHITGYNSSEVADLLGLGTRAIHACKTRGELSPDTHRLVICLSLIHYLLEDPAVQLRWLSFFNHPVADLSGGGVLSVDPMAGEFNEDTREAMQDFVKGWDTHA